MFLILAAHGGYTGQRHQGKIFFTRRLDCPRGISFLLSLKNSPSTYIQRLYTLAATLLAFIFNGALGQVRPQNHLSANAGKMSRTLPIVDNILIIPAGAGHFLPARIPAR